MDDIHVGSLDGEWRLLDIELLRSRTGEVTVLHGAGRYHRSLGIRSAGHVLVVDIREDIVLALHQCDAVVGQCGSRLLRLAVVGQVGHLAHEAVLQGLLTDGERLGVLTHIEIMSLHGLDGHGRSVLHSILVAGHHIVRVGHGIVRAQYQHLAAVLHGEGRCMRLCVVGHGQDVGDGDVRMVQMLLVHGQRTLREGDVVVAAGQAAGRDVVVACAGLVLHVAASECQCAAQDSVRLVVHEAVVRNGVLRSIVAEGHALVVGSDGQRLLRDVKLLLGGASVVALTGDGHRGGVLGRSSSHVHVVRVAVGEVGTLHQRHVVIGDGGLGSLCHTCVDQRCDVGDEAVLQGLRQDGEGLRGLAGVLLAGADGGDGHSRSILSSRGERGVGVVAVGHGVIHILGKNGGTVLHGDVGCQGLAGVGRCGDVIDGDVGIGQQLLIGAADFHVGASHRKGPLVGLTFHGSQRNLVQQVNAGSALAACGCHGGIPLARRLVHHPARAGRDDDGHLVTFLGGGDILLQTLALAHVELDVSMSFGIGVLGDREVRTTSEVCIVSNSGFRGEHCNGCYLVG